MVRALDLQLTVEFESLQYGDFSIWRPPPSWIWKILHFQQSKRSRVQNYVIMPNFVEIAWTAVEISQFFIFHNDGRRYLVLKRSSNCFTVCKISSKSLKPRPRYVSFNITLVRLENAYSRPFWGVFGALFPPNDVTYELPVLTIISTCTSVSRWRHTPLFPSGVPEDKLWGSLQEQERVLWIQQPNSTSKVLTRGRTDHYGAGVSF